MMRLQLFVGGLVALITAGVHAGSPKENATCSRDVLGFCLAPTSASLLQKAVHRHRKTLLTQEQVPQPEDNLYDTACTGYQAQGRCWFLSKTGDSCDSTCALQGRHFSYTNSNLKAPVMPGLVGHEPKAKQEAWAALECYVPSEDRYHPANENAARHYVNKTGSWSHKNCKLACPCGVAEPNQCSWSAPPACAPEFMWKGVKYTGCANVDLEHERPWCQHNFKHTDKDSGNYVADWSYCTYSCPTEKQTAPSQPAPEKPSAPSLPEKSCGWMPALSCVRQFNYKNTNFVGCTTIDHDTPWCSNEEVYKGSWNQCTYTCKQQEQNVPLEEAICTWQPKLQCATTFEYKGVEYTGCTAEDYPSPWCSIDRIHKGAWVTCDYSCLTPKPSAPSQSAPEKQIAASLPEENCGWMPASSCVMEFDYKSTHVVGCTTTDHDTPWCSNDEAYKGSWNQCTYTCKQDERNVPSEETICTWQPKPQCAMTFEYKGVEYTGCTAEDYPSPWCSIDRIHKGAWVTCHYSCLTPKPSAPSQSAPEKQIAPSFPEKNCGWMPAYSCVREFDYKGTHAVGCTAADNDTPWCSNNEVYKGSWNQCTYTCKQDENTVPSEDTICTWQPKPQCSKTFEYKGVEYTGCTAQDYPSPWCSVDRIHKGAWVTCDYSCLTAKPSAPSQSAPEKQIASTLPDENCRWMPADSCVREYDYKSAHFIGCTTTDHDTPWCSNEQVYKGSWNNCTYTCKKETKVPSEETLCTWQPKSQCALSFQYKGVEYTGCTGQDYPSPWCSMDRVHKGAWETCDKVCTVPKKPTPVLVLPTLVPQTAYPTPDPKQAAYPVPQPADRGPTTPTTLDDACERSDSENDIIGNMVPLNEAGYWIASASGSPLNMKRFVCRVIGSLGCRVASLSSLMAFLPNYSGDGSGQTYKNLESDLTTLCHAGGKWVVPQPLPLR